MIWINISLNFACIVVCLILFINVFLDKRKEKKLEIFGEMILFNIFSLTADSLVCFLGSTDTNNVVLYVCYIFSIIFGYVTLMLFTRYLQAYLKIYNKTFELWKTLGDILFLILSLCVLVAITVENAEGFDNVSTDVSKYGTICFAYPIIVLFVNAILVLSNKEPKVIDKVLSMVYIVIPLLGIFLGLRGFGFFFVYVAVSLDIFLAFVFLYTERSKQLIENEVVLQKTKSELMLSQIQPHFVFNTLYSIECLYDTDPDAAKKLLNDFSLYLRANINSIDSDPLININKEIEHVKHYLQIEKVRFGKRLDYELDIKVDGFSVPTLTIQPMVENAVKHGLMKRNEGGKVIISTYEDVDNYYVKISDNGIGFDEKEIDITKSIGITNVRKRLDLCCNGSLKIDSVINEGTNVELIIPKNIKRG